MLVLAVKPGHDGNVAAVADGRLLFSLEGEKDSFYRHIELQPTTLLDLVTRLGEVPDVVALSGWNKAGDLGQHRIGAGYRNPRIGVHQKVSIFGTEITLFSDTHERSHVLGTIGMAPKDDADLRVVLLWEGVIGSFYLVDSAWRVVEAIPVTPRPGVRYALLYSIADPTFADTNLVPRDSDAGKLMALAAFGDPAAPSPGVAETVERLATGRPLGRKGAYRDSPLYNIGVEAQETKDAAALLTNRLFDLFARAARDRIAAGLPLYIAGGCGLNCDWNARWRDLGHFSSVFVPPCTNDSGSAIGTAIDAVATLGGEPWIQWDVYSGLEFEHDVEPSSERWKLRRMTEDAVAGALADGRIFAWVQGRWEIGPRALGNRSILAEPFDPRTRDRLNEIKQREGYRPIAPCCRVEDLTEAYRDGFEDPYMLYFKRARRTDLGAVTHVDGTARVQTVSAGTNPRLHGLLSAFAERRGIGVLCNTSLNFKGFGFINRMSDLAHYCEQRGIADMVVGDRWWQLRAASGGG